MRKTIRNVMIVVPVLMISCHVSENPKIGPVTAQIMITSTASMNVVARPAARDVLLAASPNNLASLPGALGSWACRGSVFYDSTIPSLSSSGQNSTCKSGECSTSGTLHPHQQDC